MIISQAIFQDVKANKGNAKGIFILTLFRLAHLASSNKFLFIIMLPYLIAYRFFIEWVLGIELPYKVQIGRGLKLYHAQALVINRGVIIGNNCTLRQSTTIGNKVNEDSTFTNCPIIGDNVDIGANCCILGEITIGNNVKIGAGSVVVKSVPDNCVVAGNPAKLIRILTSST